MHLHRILPRALAAERSHQIGKHPSFVERLLWDAAHQRLLSCGAWGQVTAWAPTPEGAWRATASVRPALSASPGRWALRGLLPIGEARVLVYGNPNVACVLSLPDLSAPVLLRGHTDSIACAAVQGGRILTGGNDNTARCWDAETGQLLWTTPRQRFWIQGVVWLPDGDAAMMVLHGPVFRVREGRVLGTIGPETVCGRVLCADVDGGRLWIGEAEQVTLFSLVDDTATVLPADGTCRGLALVPGRDAVLFASEEGIVGVLDRYSFEDVGHHGSGALGVRALVVDGALVGVVSWGLDRQVCVWDPEASISRLLDRHTDHTNTIGDVVVVDGAVFTASADETIRRWRPALCGETFVPPAATQGYVTGLHFADANTLLSTHGSDEGCHVWSLREAGVRSTVPGVPRPPGAIVLGGKVVVPSREGVCISEPDGTGAEHVGWPGIRDIFDVDDGSGDVVFASMAGTVWRADARTGAVRWHTALHASDTFLIVSSSAGLLCAGGDVAVLDPDSGAVRRRFTGHRQPVQLVRMLDDERAISLSRKDGRLWVWSVHTGEPAAQQLPHGPNYVDLHVWDDRLYATLNGGGLVVWSLDLRTRLAQVRLSAEGYPSRMSSTARYLAVHSWGTVHRLEHSTIAATGLQQSAPEDWDSSYAMDHDGRIAIATDKTLQLHSAAGTLVFAEEDRWSGVIFSKSGETPIVVAGSKARLVARHARSGALLWETRVSFSRLIEKMLPLPALDRLLVGDGNGRVLSVSLSTGTVHKTLGGMSGTPSGIVKLGSGAITWADSGDVLQIYAGGRSGWLLQTGLRLTSGTAAGERHALIGHEAGVVLVSEEGRIVDSVSGAVLSRRTASNNDWAAAGTDTGAVHIWDCRDVSAPPRRAENTAPGYGHSAAALCWHPERAELFAVWGAGLYRWTPGGGWVPLATVEGAVWCVSVLGAGHIAVSLVSGVLVLLGADGQQLARVVLPSAVRVMAQWGDRLAAGDGDGMVYAWDVGSGQ